MDGMIDDYIWVDKATYNNANLHVNNHEDFKRCIKEDMGQMNNVQSAFDFLLGHGLTQNPLNVFYRGREFSVTLKRKLEITEK